MQARSQPRSKAARQPDRQQAATATAGSRNGYCHHTGNKGVARSGRAPRLKPEPPTAGLSSGLTKGRPLLSSAGRFWLRSLLPGPSAARLRTRSSRGGLTTPARSTRAYSVGTATPVRTDHVTASGATRGPGSSGQGRPQVRPRPTGRFWLPTRPESRAAARRHPGVLPSFSGRPRSLWHPRMACFLF
ncbi:hypothetical protein NDU88_003382 [Pleurodeles waltl]|uniref:Uncharacterized protein n=1 Tax=Pleurodeles waltl TaxID=8319 RepID=A0AAV7VD64_PLEWA|nr:hypothetical protein NDU88_003382 [Pleurodeles waltl]